MPAILLLFFIALLLHQSSQEISKSMPPTAILSKHIENFKTSTVDVTKSFSTLNKNVSNSLSQRIDAELPRTELNDIFISVKTTKNNHRTRLALIIDTWFQLAQSQTWFYSDADDPLYQKKTGGHLVNTNCSKGHHRSALCCKMSAEFNAFVESGKNWFCHFDDDNYVNVPRLVKLLNGYNPSSDWYLGKPSISSPLEMHSIEPQQNATTHKPITFWFATGGAGFCLSRALTQKMLPIAGGGQFISIADKIRFPDDVTMGFIIEHLLKVPLTVVDGFHSHLEPLEFLNPYEFQHQVSFSYAQLKQQWNIVNVNGFDLKTDPKRFYSLHCKLFPYFKFCLKS